MGLGDDDTDLVNVFSSPEPENVAVSSLELDAEGDCDGGDCETVTVRVHGTVRDREAVPSSDAERVSEASSLNDRVLRVATSSLDRVWLNDERVIVREIGRAMLWVRGWLGDAVFDRVRSSDAEKVIVTEWLMMADRLSVKLSVSDDVEEYDDDCVTSSVTDKVTENVAEGLDVAVDVPEAVMLTLALLDIV